MRTALVLLSGRDTDAPQLGGIATVSKDDPTDHGGYALGAAAAKRGALWVDRPYFTGNPDPSAILAKAKLTKAAGWLVQLGNEPNLPLEGWQGGASAYATIFHQLDAALPDTFLYAPMSPGIPGWQEWVSPMEPRYAVHAYGSRDQMQAVVQWYLDHTAGALYVTEVNFGAGQVADRDKWAREQLAPFPSWCQTGSRIKLVAYFAWRWDQDPKLPASVDATPVTISVLQGAGASMHKRLYLHQFDQLGEQSVAAIAATLKSGGVSEVVCKTHQYLTYTGHFDTSPLKPDSLAAVQQRRDAFAAEGITMLPWCVPMGIDLDAESKFAAEVAALFGGVIEFDVEPYRDPGEEFWTGDYSLLVPFFQKVKALGVTFDVHFPPIPSGVNPWPNLAGALALARNVWTKSYWTDFGQSWQATLDQSVGYLDKFGVDRSRAGVIYPFNGAATYAAATDYLASKSVQRVGVWKMGNAGQGVYQALAKIQETMFMTIEQPDPTKADPEYQKYAPKTGTWREVADNLLGVCNDALATGRKLKALDDQASQAWGNR